MANAALHFRFAVLLNIALYSGNLFGQWPAYASGGPKTKDGQFDKNAPAPKTAEGTPDLSGIWDALPPGNAPGTGLGGAPPAGGGRGGGRAGGAPKRPFISLPSVVPGGLPLQPWAAKLRADRLANGSIEHPDAHCLPIQPVQLHSHPQPRKIVQTPGLIVIIYEANGGLRQIFTDGRALPKNDPQPWWAGYSVGKWEGDTLVVETIGFRDDLWLDEEGTPMTGNGKMTERFHRTNFGTLEIDITLDDSKTFTKPFGFKLTQHLMPDTELIEFICLENEKSAVHYK